MTLLIVAGLFLRSLLAVQQSDLGFDPQHTLNVTMDPHLAGYDQDQSDQLVDSVLERVRAFQASGRRAWQLQSPWAATIWETFLRSRALDYHPDSKVLRQVTTLSPPVISKPCTFPCS